jgi:hypothetical protein
MNLSYKRDLKKIKNTVKFALHEKWYKQNYAKEKNTIYHYSYNHVIEYGI